MSQYLEQLRARYMSLCDDLGKAQLAELELWIKDGPTLSSASLDAREEAAANTDRIKAEMREIIAAARQLM